MALEVGSVLNAVTSSNDVFIRYRIQINPKYASTKRYRRVNTVGSEAVEHVLDE